MVLLVGAGLLGRSLYQLLRVDIVDGRDWDRLDEIFTPDAVIDFSAFGGPADTVAGIKPFLRDSLAAFKRTQHMMGLPNITLDGDSARARTSCSNPMVLDNPDGTTSVWLIGLWYDDTFRRTTDGWRFTSRRQERCYSVIGRCGFLVLSY